jgi:riboflavin synthase
MFTGIVEEVGRVSSVSNLGDKARLVIQAELVLEGICLGASINIDGVCQTVAAIDSPTKGTFTVDTLAESLKKTTLGALRPGSPVNLERALRADSRMGGHFVQGHITCTARIQSLRTTGNNVYLTVEIPDEQLRYCVREGSIALDGISLTIAQLSGNAATMNIIPATLKATSLGNKQAGDLMNLETDIIGRYVERLFSPAAKGLSFERLRELGY